MKWLKKMITWSRIKSPWVIHFNTGACNACDIEIVAALTPRHDIERFGIMLKGTPRHADVLLCSGPVTRQIQDRLKRIYDQMPEPKFVVAVGTCACSGGVFQGWYRRGDPGFGLHSRMPGAARGHYGRGHQTIDQPAGQQAGGRDTGNFNTGEKS